MRVILKPKTCRDPIWYPDVVTLYVVVSGTAKFILILPDIEPQIIEAKEFTYIFVPIGTLHTFINTSTVNDLIVLAFFDKENPQPEVSLSLSTQFFPKAISNYTLTKYSGRDDLVDDDNKIDKIMSQTNTFNRQHIGKHISEPLNDLRPEAVTPYILSLPSEKHAPIIF